MSVPTAGRAGASGPTTDLTDAAADVRSVVVDVLERGDGSWAACADAGLLGLAAPTSLGGEGLGLAELAPLVQESGRRALSAPFLETLVAGLLPLVRYGDRALVDQLVPRVVTGQLLLAPAVHEVGAFLSDAPRVRLEDGALTGQKTAVPVLDGETVLLVTATGPDGPCVALVEAPPPVATVPGSAGRSEATYAFDDTPVLGVLGDGAVEGLLDLLRVGLVLQGDGLLAGARDLTAGYIRERTQFGRSLAEFQAVAMQMADVYVVSRLTSLVATEACRRVSAGEPAQDDVAVAAAWFADRAPSALQTCHHLHGGVGVDETYPLHHHFAAVKDVVRHLGGAVATLAGVPPRERDAKNAELTEAQRSFKQEVRDYFSTLVPQEDRLEMMSDRHGPAYHRTIKQMGSDGWMGVGWPEEYGGHGLGGIEQQIFANEAARADVHLPSVTLQTVGPTLQAFGTPEQKQRFLGDILAGDVHFAIGYSEPDAGTDLAALRTTARRATDERGDHYVVNGQKLWTTGGHAADYVWLAVRTDPDAPKHKGISVLIVDTSDPGYSWTPIITSDGSHHVNATYYNDVRVPADMLVGEENQGWKLITTQLNHERVMLGPAGRIEGLRDLVADWARSRTTPDGTPLLEVAWVREVLSRSTMLFRVNELLNWEVAGGTASAKQAVADASASKVFASDEVQQLGLQLESIVAAYGDPAEEDTALLRHFLDATSKRNLVLTFGGGVNEVQRELICMFGLGLPKVPR